MSGFLRPSSRGSECLRQRRLRSSPRPRTPPPRPFPFRTVPVASAKRPLAASMILFIFRSSMRVVEDSTASCRVDAGGTKKRKKKKSCQGKKPISHFRGIANQQLSGEAGAPAEGCRRPGDEVESRGNRSPVSGSVLAGIVIAAKINSKRCLDAAPGDGLHRSIAGLADGAEQHAVHHSTGI